VHQRAALRSCTRVLCTTRVSVKRPGSKHMPCDTIAALSGFLSNDWLQTHHAMRLPLSHCGTVVLLRSFVLFGAAQATRKRKLDTGDLPGLSVTPVPETPEVEVTSKATRSPTVDRTTAKKARGHTVGTDNTSQVGGQRSQLRSPAAKALMLRAAVQLSFASPPYHEHS
jgi:hypothetical protein